MVQIETRRIRRNPEVKEILLSAATRVFASDGYSGKSLAIAEQSGYAEGSIYRHFASKEALAVAVVDRAAKICRETLVSAVDGKESQSDRINALLNAEEILYSQPEGKVFYMFLREANSSEELRRSLQQFMKLREELYNQVIKNDLVSYRIFGVVLGVGLIAKVQGQGIFDSTIEHLRNEFAKK